MQSDSFLAAIDNEDYSLLTSDLKKAYTLVKNREQFLQFVSTLGTLDSLVFLREFSILENYDNIAHSIASSGDLQALQYFDTYEDIFLYIDELLSSDHYEIVEYIIDQYGEHLIDEHLSSSTPMLYKYCAIKKINLELVVKQAYEAAKGEALGEILNLCIAEGYYPTIDVAVKSTSEVVEKLLIYDPDQNEDTVLVAIDNMVDDSIAEAMFDYFPDVSITFDTIVNAMIHRLKNVVDKLTDVKILQQLTEIEYSYWETYTEDMIWLLKTLKLEERFPTFQIAPTLIWTLAKENEKELICRLLETFEIKRPSALHSPKETQVSEDVSCETQVSSRDNHK